MNKYIIFAILTIFFSGCASYQPPKEYKFDKTRTYNQKFNDIWDKIVKYCIEYDIPLKNMDKNSGLIVSEYNLNDKLKDCLDCGQLASLQSFDNFAAIFNFVVKKRTDNITEVIITTYYKTAIVVPNLASVYAPPIRKPIDCNSTGVLEKQIFDYLETGDKISNSNK
jgi:hypothetical protein